LGKKTFKVMPLFDHKENLVSADVPAEIQAMADKLGINVEELLEKFGSPLAGKSEDAAPTQEAQVVPTETTEQRLERELAVSQQEQQQLRKLMQTEAEGRVVGSGGQVMGTAAASPPDLAGLEPGLRYLARNGLITLEDLEQRIAPSIAKTMTDLLKNDLGGVI
jgi:predicted metalloprotease with PDZ domain